PTPTTHVNPPHPMPAILQYDTTSGPSTAAPVVARSLRDGVAQLRARPATKRAVAPGRARTPSRESNRIAPASESPTRDAPMPANGPSVAGHPYTRACSG